MGLFNQLVEVKLYHRVFKYWPLTCSTMISLSPRVTNAVDDVVVDVGENVVVDADVVRRFAAGRRVVVDSKIPAMFI